jgi:hypothetical protein
MVLRKNDSLVKCTGFLCAIVFAIVGVVMIVSPAISEAKTFFVTSRSDLPDQYPGDGVCKTQETEETRGVCTLRAAIMEANAYPGADTIRLPRGTFRLTLQGISIEKAGAIGDLDITDKLTIVGTANESGEPLTIIDAAKLNDRIFDIHDSSVVVMSNLILRNGTAWRRYNVPNAPSQYDDDNQYGNFYCPVIEPTDKGDGGAILNRGGVVLLTALNFEGNLAQCDGGAVDNISDGIMLLTKCNFTNNAAGRDGGALENDEDSMMTISQALFEWNNAYENGGAISNDDSMMTIKSAQMRYNSASVFGGGIWNGDSDAMTLTGVTIMYNNAEDGGGIWNNDGFLKLRSTIVEMNAPNDIVDNNIPEE